MQINSEGVFIFFVSDDDGSFPVKALYLLRAFLDGFAINGPDTSVLRVGHDLPPP